MVVVFPSDYFSQKKPDEMYNDQFKAFGAAGGQTATINLSELADNSKVLGAFDAGKSIYRGWMLTARDYEVLYKALSSSNLAPITKPASYANAHYIPNWYPKIADFTPETIFFSVDDDLTTELGKLGWDKFFIKDHVKSLKTANGSIIDSPEKVTELMENMKKFRGQIEGGLAVRRVENIVQTTEKRYFVVAGIPYASDISEQIPEILKQVAGLIDSPFYSVDIAKTAAGVDRIIEIGDGQVSDITGWAPDRLAGIVLKHL